jgi:hypothetical protein
MTERNDQIVADYLSQVSRATVGLPRERRDELISDLREHIETGRAELPAETEAQVRELLDRLGDPGVIGQAAAEDAGVWPPAGGALPAGAPASATPGRRRAVIISAVVLAVLVVVLCAGLLFFTQVSEGAAVT